MNLKLIHSGKIQFPCRLENGTRKCMDGSVSESLNYLLKENLPI